jgi:hypothetical protein
MQSTQQSKAAFGPGGAMTANRWAAASKVNLTSANSAAEQAPREPLRGGKTAGATFYFTLQPAPAGQPTSSPQP